MQYRRCAASGASLAVLATLCLPPSEALADQSSIIVTSSRFKELDQRLIEQTAGGVDFIPADEFRDRLAVSLRDTLAWSPGVYAQPRFGQEVRISIRGSGLSRGFHMRGLTLLQDGIPLNLADDNGDFQELDPQIFSHIEVYRGANALRHGGTTLGGAINAVTPTGRTAQGLELRVDGGSFQTLRAKAVGGMQWAQADAYLAVTADRSDGDRDHARRSSLRLHGNVGVPLSSRAETRFYASVNHIRQELPGALTMAQALSTPSAAATNTILGDHKRDIDSVRLQNRTSLMLDNGQLVGGVFFNARNLFHPIFQVVDQKSSDWGSFVRLDLAGQLGQLPVKTSFGATARFGHVNARNFVNQNGRRGQLLSDATQEARTLNAFAEIRVKPAPGLSLIAGGMLVEGMRDVNHRLNSNRSGRASYDSFSPRFGILYERQDLQIFANLSRSVELPGYSELNQTPYALNGLAPSGFVDLDPQRAWTTEAGARGKLGFASFDISFYRSSLKGELLQFDQGAGVTAATFNAGRTIHQGVEAGLDLQALSWLRLRQVYTFSDFRFDNDPRYGNNRLPVVPRHFYRAEVRLGSEKLYLAPSVEWVPQGAWADYRNLVRTPAYALVGATASATLPGNVTLFVDARNLTNRRALGDVSAVVEASAASAIYYPVERRAIYGGVRATF